MSAIFAKTALLADGWANDVRLEISDLRLASVVPDSVAAIGDHCVDVLLPALSNLHSHSFQRGMAGMTEHRAAGRESFWTWREAMYGFIQHLSPEHIEAIAALTFMEMQEAGYAAVGEFHYVHHQLGGKPYTDMAELSHRIMAAAGETGIGLTHLPVLYSYGGAGRQSLAGGQLRFGNSVDAFAKLLDASRAAARALPGDAKVGLAPHSLRATAPEELRQAIELGTGQPIHIHVAEQTKEVEEVSAWLGAAPVQWLMDNTNIDAHWCCIHATHLNADETSRLAQSGAVAGLCPITEANLGDGRFNGPGWLAAGGAFGIGSDSNVKIALGEELSMFEYSQRLFDRSRNVMVKDGGSVGHFLYTAAAKGGAQALGRDAGAIATGKLADLLAIDSSALSLFALRRDQLLDGLCFAAGAGVVTDLWSAGRHKVKQGRHVAHDVISARYRRAMTDLVSRMKA